MICGKDFRFVTLGVSVLLIAVLFFGSCKKSEPEGKGEEGQKETEKTNEAAGEQGNESDMVALDIEFPSPMFVGTPANISGVSNLEKPRGEGEERPTFYVPAGTVNVAASGMVSTGEEPIIGDIEMITDGDKQAVDGSFVELGPFKQYVTIDLGKVCEIYAVNVWHYHQQPRVYFDVVVQVADDADFITGVETLFNNDIDNSSGLGVGEDKHYVETSEGKLIDGKGVNGRYVRLYSRGNNSNELNHYIEVAVYGKPVK